jgi:AraC family transcriptional regulator, positive regulator of tynA and feaB
MAVSLERPRRQRWSTEDVESRHALAYWVDTICKSFLEIDIDSPARHFHGSLAQSELGPATLYVVAADTQSIRRTRARIAHSRYAGYFLLQLRAGQLRFQQYGRDSCIETGDCVLVDCNAPYRLECLPATRSVALRFSQEWLRNWIPSPESLAGRPLRSGTGWSNALCAVLANLDIEREEELALPESTVAEQIAALLALAAGPDAQASTGSDKLFNRVRRTLRDRCHEQGLSPATVADEHGISKRYLHYLCAHASTTFREELMRMRLDCAHRLLSDRRYDALSVIEVTARCGFVEPSHFARRFRKAFGLGPTEFRALSARGSGQRHP